MDNKPLCPIFIFQSEKSVMLDGSILFCEYHDVIAPDDVFPLK